MKQKEAIVGKYISIEEMEKHIAEMKSAFIEVGYMQASCNEEGLVDFGDAIRIYIEDNFGILQSGCYRLFGTMIELKMKKIWYEEFPNDFCEGCAKYDDSYGYFDQKNFD